MKRNLVVYLALIILTIFTTNTYASALGTSSVNVKLSSSTLKDIKYSKNSNQDSVEINLESYKGYKVSTLPNPYRIIVDIPNTIVSTGQKRIDVNSSRIKAIRYAQFDSKTARVVLDVIGQPKYQIVEKTGKLVIYIVNPILSNMYYYIDGDKANLVLPGANLTDTKAGGKKLYTEKYEADDRKYTMTFPNSIIALGNKTVKLSDNFFDSIQISTNITSKQTSIVFTAKAKYTYAAAAKSDIKGTAINIYKYVEPSRGDDPRDINVFVKYSSKDSVDTVAIITSNYTNYNVMRLTGIDRVVIDIPNAVAPDSQQTVNVNSSLIKSIRYVQFEQKTARVVIDLVSQSQYEVVEDNGQLLVNIKKPTYKNFTYFNNGDRVCFLLDGAKLTEGGESLKEFFTDQYDNDGKKYTITFPSNLANLGTGEMKVNDSFLDSVQIISDSASQKTSIVFNAKDKFVFRTITRPELNDTAITILKPAAPGEKLIIIDPGHGGMDPGAVSGDALEKDLNLDISLKLNALLKSKNIKTYITREDDSFIGLYERAYIANDLNAKLFLCVHNNAYNSEYNGTETLYYGSRAVETGMSGKKFAQLIQNALVSTLKSFDRKIVARPGLVVLKATKMPAVLAEVGFITNKAEREKLMRDDYRQKAAQALCDSVIKALSEIN